MSFKDLLKDDITDVFMDPDEFAKEYNIDGQPVLCVIDEDKSSKSQTDGVYVVRRRLFVSLAGLGYRPVPEQKMNVDNQSYFVVDCLGDDLLEIVLEANMA